MTPEPFSADLIWRNRSRIRAEAPLVLNITNFVSANLVANTLLAIGASPLMAQAEEELDDLLPKSKALVLNIGTLSSESVKAMKTAAQLAKKAHVPVVLDPVGAGATAFRTHSARALLDDGFLSVVRGNASEIRWLRESGHPSGTKGVDSQHSVDEVRSSANALATTHFTTVAVSGEVDYLTDGQTRARVLNGHPLMTKVTGMGCAATSMVGAFLAVDKDPLMAAICAMAVMGIAGELAAERAQGPGSFAAYFQDALYNLSLDEIRSRIRVEIS